MPAPNHRRIARLRRAGEWGLVVAGVALLLLACAPEKRNRVVRLLFDGAPTDEPPPRVARETHASAPAFAATVSSRHASFATHCEHCHLQPSMALADGNCVACHIARPHTANEQIDTTGNRCGMCHHEHAGRTADLTIVATQRCTACHRVHPFEASHPEFALAKADEESVREAKYATGLEVFHSTHLKQTVRAGPRQGKTLDCVDCHVPAAVGTGFNPPTYEKTCGGCHPIPMHKNVSPPDWAALRAKIDPATDAELVLLSDARWRHAEQELEKEADDTKDDAKQKKLEDQLDSLRAARTELKQGPSKDCLLCHSLSEKKVQDRRVAVIPPTAHRSEWFERVAFSHTAHAYLSCTHCHRVPASAGEELGRLMLPGIATCTACHREDGCSTTCAVCHTYHDRTPVAVPYGAQESEAIKRLNIGRAATSQ